ncbi:hypothetical protein G7K_3294-t1 [Saitoella complicata NRRL Y-17804]|uniref:Uncharacterized protein n=1 Tax=Saitoella complicata (strain BCRC 22490 / CBS 7301 / JCM 7358 / NBRC 10748 / NRRL Y-17804) TaxID=698492 RepID=A0A0E9NHH9_SAICN|nr:hypothetical protein G7K_3294-t1 [Saitoella complicata NRRL Y-17804]
MLDCPTATAVLNATARVLIFEIKQHQRTSVFLKYWSWHRDQREGIRFRKHVPTTRGVVLFALKVFMVLEDKCVFRTESLSSTDAEVRVQSFLPERISTWPVIPESNDRHPLTRKTRLLCTPTENIKQNRSRTPLSGHAGRFFQITGKVHWKATEENMEASTSSTLFAQFIGNYRRQRGRFPYELTDEQRVEMNALIPAVVLATDPVLTHTNEDVRDNDNAGAQNPNPQANAAEKDVKQEIKKDPR